VACGLWHVGQKKRLVACGVDGPVPSVFPTSYVLRARLFSLRATRYMPGGR
jgi:hypothetical protein